ncbi:MAG: hypothetical protein PCFJNLEI_03234 [Verrucomicrobiae bacterium]|nr:hypothetical protein [Verrucomicrobiae bacterium]
MPNQFLATDSNITYTGRWADLPTATGPLRLAITSGGSFRFKFTGSSVTLTFQPFTLGEFRPELSYSIDGQPPVRTVLAPELALTGLPTGEHSLIVWVEGVAVPLQVKRWSCRQGVGLRSVTLAATGQLAPYPTGHTKKLLLIGDSIGEGLLMRGGTAWTNYPAFANARLNFGNQLGTRLHADVWCHCFGGAAIAKPFNDLPPAADNYPFILQGVPHTDPAFDAILIEAGHNDYGIEPAPFVDSYRLLLAKVRQANPPARLFLFPPLKPHAPAKFDLVQALAAETQCIFIDNSGWKITMPNDGHPDVAGHTQIADYLAPLISPHLTEWLAAGQNPVDPTPAPP